MNASEAYPFLDFLREVRDLSEKYNVWMYRSGEEIYLRRLDGTGFAAMEIPSEGNPVPWEYGLRLP